MKVSAEVVASDGFIPNTRVLWDARALLKQDSKWNKKQKNGNPPHEIPLVVGMMVWVQYLQQRLLTVQKNRTIIKKRKANRVCKFFRHYDKQAQVSVK